MGVFNSPKKSDIDSIFSTAAQAASIIDTLNVKLKKKKYTEITAGIACHDADVLMIKAGYSGSGINEVTWIGKLVGETADLCSKANRWNSKRTLYSKTFYNNLTDDYRKRIDWLNWNSTYECYEGETINSTMNQWVIDNG